VTHHRSPDIRQHDTHKELLESVESPESACSARVLDAIIVPASRPTRNLSHAVRLARAADTRLVVLCSRNAHAHEVYRLLRGEPAPQVIAIDLPCGYRHPWLEFATSRLDDLGLPEACAARSTDLSIKRNVGLLLARMLGWEGVFFMDDDIRAIAPAELRRTASMLGRYNSVGMRVTDFPDNSVVCHAHRETGEFQDVLVSGSALAVDCSGPIGFFPNVYNEDWFFFFNDAAERRLASSDLKAKQLRYDPFEDPQRAAGQEFGDILAEGLYALLHRGQRSVDATRDYWATFLDARTSFLDAIVARAHRARPDVRGKMLDAVGAALDCATQIEPDQCEAYIMRWSADLDRWERNLKKIPRTSSVNEALSKLDLPPTAGIRRRRLAVRTQLVRIDMPSPPPAEPGGPQKTPTGPTVSEERLAAVGRLATVYKLLAFSVAFGMRLAVAVGSTAPKGKHHRSQSNLRRWRRHSQSGAAERLETTVKTPDCWTLAAQESGDAVG
jgi:hypothetical protein